MNTPILLLLALCSYVGGHFNQFLPRIGWRTPLGNLLWRRHFRPAAAPSPWIRPLWIRPPAVHPPPWITPPWVKPPWMRPPVLNPWMRPPLIKPPWVHPQIHNIVTNHRKSMFERFNFVGSHRGYGPVGWTPRPHSYVFGTKGKYRYGKRPFIGRRGLFRLPGKRFGYKKRVNRHIGKYYRKGTGHLGKNKHSFGTNYNNYGKKLHREPRKHFRSVPTLRAFSPFEAKLARSGHHVFGSTRYNPVNSYGHARSATKTFGSARRRSNPNLAHFANSRSTLNFESYREPRKSFGRLGTVPAFNRHRTAPAGSDRPVFGSIRYNSVHSYGPTRRATKTFGSTRRKSHSAQFVNPHGTLNTKNTVRFNGVGAAGTGGIINPPTSLLNNRSVNSYAWSTELDSATGPKSGRRTGGFRPILNRARKQPSRQINSYAFSRKQDKNLLDNIKTRRGILNRWKHGY